MQEIPEPPPESGLLAPQAHLILANYWYMRREPFHEQELLIRRLKKYMAAVWNRNGKYPQDITCLYCGQPMGGDTLLAHIDMNVNMWWNELLEDFIITCPKATCIQKGLLYAYENRKRIGGH